MNTIKAKAIIAHFLKIEAEEINEFTIMNHNAISSSLMLHRMFATLAEEGYIVDDPAAIESFGDFLNAIEEENHNDSSNLIDKKDIESKIVNNDIKPKLFNTNSLDSIFLIGVDIEQIKEFKYVDNFTSDQFYIENFSKDEISYCINKPNKLQSFAGLFAAKEAIVKADNDYKGLNFNQIIISHDPLNKPMFEGFVISISHASDYAIAVAVRPNKLIIDSSVVNNLSQELEIANKNQIKTYLIASLAILIIFNLISWQIFL